MLGFGHRDRQSGDRPFDVDPEGSFGMLVPWHSHTAQEQIMMVNGTIVAEMAGHPATTLGPGGFAVMAGGMAHQFTCQDTACLMFVTFDRAYDIFWGKGG
jgi:anti-sigma factor ChrR (cupin superfamily)